MDPRTQSRLLAGIDLQAGLTQVQAERIYALGKEAVVFALLEQARLLAVCSNPPVAIAADPSTPSGQKPVFAKPNTREAKRRKKAGRKAGHPGNRRPTPVRIDRTVEHRASCCPACGGPLQPCSATRRRIIEDVFGSLKEI